MGARLEVEEELGVGGFGVVTKLRCRPRAIIRHEGGVAWKGEVYCCCAVCGVLLCIVLLIELDEVLQRWGWGIATVDHFPTNVEPLLFDERVE